MSPVKRISFGSPVDSLQLRRMQSLRFAGASGREAGVVATLGPATDNPETVKTLIDAGANIFRLNFSHGEQADHGQRIQWIRNAEAELKQEGRLTTPVEIMADVQGPKIRVGKIDNPACRYTAPDGKEKSCINLEKGRRVFLTGEETSNDPGKIPVTFPEMIDALSGGQRILLADGTMELAVVKPARDSKDGLVECTVLREGRLTDGKGINLPDVRLNTPALSEKDMADIRFALGKGVDKIAISFVRSAKDMVEARRYIQRLIKEGKVPAEAASKVQLYAKIEKPEAVEPQTLREIVAASDGVMVARGDLGIEVDTVDVPELQERIIREAKRQGKKVIVATQMLESMMHSTFPSRADVSDIADAVKDGADYVMLSGETSIGDHPVECVRMMDRIIRKYEPQRSFRATLRKIFDELSIKIRQLILKIRRSIAQL